MRVLVAGATGRVGSAVVRYLLEQGMQVRALVRSPRSAWVKRMMAQGVELAPGDVLRPASLRSVCMGVDVVVSAVTRRGYVSVVEGKGNAHLIDVARLMGVKQYIYISAVGANRADGVPDLETKGQVEVLLRESGLHATIIRPAPFHETLCATLVGNLALVGGKQAHPCGWIAADDVGRVAALCCGRADLYGTTLELAGPELLTFDAAYAAMGRGSGRPIRILHVPLGLMRLGQPFSRVMAEQIALMAFFNTHGAAADPTLIERRFDFRPQRIEEWARTLPQP